VEIEGLRIWGSPYTPKFQSWYFMKDRGYPMKENWKEIPTELDLLLTHGPPYGILDTNINGINTGCRDLLDAIFERPPRYNIFGHIHEAYGTKEVLGIKTKFMNCSYLDENYIPKNRFQIFDL
jgi:Icc-related predicted phosphoesterase